VVDKRNQEEKCPHCDRTFKQVGLPERSRQRPGCCMTHQRELLLPMQAVATACTAAQHVQAESQRTLVPSAGTGQQLADVLPYTTKPSTPCAHPISSNHRIRHSAMQRQQHRLTQSTALPAPWRQHCARLRSTLLRRKTASSSTSPSIMRGWSRQTGPKAPQQQQRRRLKRLRHQQAGPLQQRAYPRPAAAAVAPGALQQQQGQLAQR
jgi:hypothetical protein